MRHVSFTELRANMAKHFDRVEADRAELVVTRQMPSISAAPSPNWMKAEGASAH
jgi:PHD/YefM family antitoxin component YafN of YafNO toxin-antitoxin module